MIGIKRPLISTPKTYDYEKIDITIFLSLFNS